MRIQRQIECVLQDPFIKYIDFGWTWSGHIGLEIFDDYIVHTRLSLSYREKPIDFYLFVAIAIKRTHTHTFRVLAKFSYHVCSLWGVLAINVKLTHQIGANSHAQVKTIASMDNFTCCRVCLTLSDTGYVICIQLSLLKIHPWLRIPCVIIVAVDCAFDDSSFDLYREIVCA